MADRPRQLRGHLTGGQADVEHFYRALSDFADREGWDLTFEDGPKPFGEFGPLRKVNFGFTTRP